MNEPVRENRRLERGQRTSRARPSHFPRIQLFQTVLFQTVTRSISAMSHRSNIHVGAFPRFAHTASLYLWTFAEQSGAKHGFTTVHNGRTTAPLFLPQTRFLAASPMKGRLNRWKWSANVASIDHCSTIIHRQISRRPSRNLEISFLSDQSLFLSVDFLSSSRTIRA